MPLLLVPKGKVKEMAKEMARMTVAKVHLRLPLVLRHGQRQDHLMANGCSPGCGCPSFLEPSHLLRTALPDVLQVQKRPWVAQIVSFFIF